MDIEIFKEKILEQYDEQQIGFMVDDHILEYIDDDWQDDGEYDDEYEWYSDFGCGEAEDDVIKEIIEDIVGIDIEPDIYVEYSNALKELFNVLDY